MEKRSRKRSRKASEREEASEEPSPPVKTRLRSSGGKTEGERKTHGRSTRSKSLRVSFDIFENGLSVCEGESAGAGRVTVASSSGDSTPAPGEGGPDISREAGPKRQAPVDVKFKKTDFFFSFLSGNKKRSWKSFKQIMAAEKSQLWRASDPTFTSLDAPPPLKPAKRYSDLSGLTGKYRDPMSGLFFYSTEEFRAIRSLPSDIITGYLALRGKLPIM